MICIATGRRKRNDSDEDIEQVLAELALEYSGEKPVKDNKVVETKVEDKIETQVEDKSESIERSIDDDDKKKKGKKDKKKEKSERNEETIDNEAMESNNADMDGEVSTVKTAAQKKKEKKEREKQKKLSQKKAVQYNLFSTIL